MRRDPRPAAGRVSAPNSHFPTGGRILRIWGVVEAGDYAGGDGPSSARAAPAQRAGHGPRRSHAESRHVGAAALRRAPGAERRRARGARWGIAARAAAKAPDAVLGARDA